MPPYVHKSVMSTEARASNAERAQLEALAVPGSWWTFDEATTPLLTPQYNMVLPN